MAIGYNSHRTNNKVVISGWEKNVCCSVLRYFAHAVLSIQWRKVLQYKMIMIIYLFNVQVFYVFALQLSDNGDNVNDNGYK